MRSLAAHLRDLDNHDALPFHPSCPVCRDTRLTGLLPTAELVPKRTQAMLAAGVLAVSAIGPPAAAVAAEHDQQQDGTAEVGQGTPPDSADSPDFDPGGDATDLPDTPPPVPQAQAPTDPGSDDTGPVDQAPATDTGDPVVDPGDNSAQTPAQEAPPTPTASEPAAPTPTPTESPTPSPGTAPTPASTPAPVPETEPAAAPQGGTRGAGPTARSQRQTRARHLADRIGTGDPDLLPVGTRLSLR